MNNWKEDKAIIEWFNKLGNKRTIKNYSNEFPHFLEYVKSQYPQYDTPSKIIEARTQQLKSDDLKTKRIFEDLVLGFKNTLQGTRRISTEKLYSYCTIILR